MLVGRNAGKQSASEAGRTVLWHQRVDGSREEVVLARVRQDKHKEE
jgi:hypothetical protein